MGNTLFIWTKKICQRIPPGVLNIFLILWTPTDCAQKKEFFIAHCQPGGAAIIFSKSARNEKQTALFIIKKLPLPLLSVSEILFGRTVLELWIFCRQRSKKQKLIIINFFHPISSYIVLFGHRTHSYQNWTTLHEKNQ